MKFRHAKNILGLPVEFKVNTRTDFDLANNLCLARMVAARKRSDSDPDALLMSQVKEAIKKERHKYCECGERKDIKSLRCYQCKNAKKADVQRNDKRELSMSVGGQLTCLQKRVASSIALGMSRREIAEKRGCCVNAIQDCVNKIARKIGASHLEYGQRVAAITRHAIFNGFLTKYLGVVLALMVGCKTAPPPRFKAIIQPPPQPARVTYFVYPPNWQDYRFWDVMHSTNGATWEIYQWLYNLEMPSGGPTNIMEVAGTLPLELFRMRGHKERIGPFFAPSEPDPVVVPWDPITDPPWGTNAPPR